MSFGLIIRIALLGGITYLFVDVDNDAYKDGYELTEHLCSCYNPETGRSENAGVGAIKTPDKYIYYAPAEYPDFRRGFLISLFANCPQYSTQLFKFRGIGINEVSVDFLDFRVEKK